jgi:hypothetical protein
MTSNLSRASVTRGKSFHLIESVYDIVYDSAMLAVVDQLENPRVLVEEDGGVPEKWFNMVKF